MVNLSLLLVYGNIKQSMYKPKHDPGILIWWFCCIRIGAKGKFTSKHYRDLAKKESSQSRQLLNNSKKL